MVILSDRKGGKYPIRWQMQTGDLANKKMDLCASLEWPTFLTVSNFFVILYLFIYHLLSDHADGVDDFSSNNLGKVSAISTSD